MAEVSSAVIATSLVLISVFVPVSFFPGTTGILYKQFSLTIAFSIAISLFNALTLSPALAAILLQGEEHKYDVLDWTHIGWLSRGYRSVCARRRSNAFTAWAAAMAAVIPAHVADPLPDGCACSSLAWRLPATCTSRAHRIRSAGRPELLHRGGAGAAGRFAFLHDTDIARRQRKFCAPIRTCSAPSLCPGSRLSGGSSPNYGLVFAPLKPIDDRKGAGALGGGNCGARFAEAVWHSGRDRSAFRAAGHSGHRQLRRIPIPAAGPGPQYAAGPGQRRAPDRELQPPAQGPDRTVYQLHRQRSAAAGADRSREGEGHWRSDQPGDAGAGRLHGLAVRQRFRLQQSLVSRLRAGRPAVPHDAQRPARILRALRYQWAGAAGQHRSDEGRRPGRR